MINSGGAQRIRESFCTHFNAVAFGYLNENAAADTIRNAETKGNNCNKEANEKAATGTIEMRKPDPQLQQ